MLNMLSIAALLIGLPNNGVFDLSGVRVGMSGNKIKSVLDLRGFKQTDQIIDYSYRQKLAIMTASNKRIPNVSLETLSSYNELQFSKQSEVIYVDFQHTRDGPIVTDVKYSIRGFYINKDDIINKAKMKFGVPSLERDGKVFWCHIDENRKCDVSKGEAVILNANDEAGIVITLTGANDERRMGDDQLKQDVRSQSGPQTSF